MPSSSQNLVTVLNYGVKVSDAGAKLDLHITQEQGSGGGVDLPNISQNRHFIVGIWKPHSFRLDLDNKYK